MEQSISDGLLVFDQNLHIITSNKGAAKMLGFESVESLLQTYSKLTELMTPMAGDSDPQLILDMSMTMVCAESPWPSQAEKGAFVVEE